MEVMTPAAVTAVNDPDWRVPLLAYLLDEVLPADRNEVFRIARHAKTYVTVDGEFYKRSPSTVGMLMKCIPTHQGKELLLEIHAEIYGHHAAASCHGLLPRFLLADRTALCGGGHPHVRWVLVLLWADPLAVDHPLTWPFAVWGLDMVGPLRKAPRGFTHLLLAMDKFTKWIEAKPITKTNSQEAVKFFQDIVYQFSMPNTIIIDNGTKSIGKKFLEFADGYGIGIDWASIGHPRTNGRVDRANGMVLQGLKPRIFHWLKKFARRWAEDLPAVL
jgi:hypothetical protein